MIEEGSVLYPYVRYAPISRNANLPSSVDLRGSAIVSYLVSM